VSEPPPFVDPPRQHERERAGEENRDEVDAKLGERPRNEGQSAYAAAVPMLVAAGIVVTRSAGLSPHRTWPSNKSASEMIFAGLCDA